MLYKYIGQNLDVGPQRGTVPQGVIGLTLYHTLLGSHHAVVDVDPYKSGAGDRGHRQGGARVVAQHVDAHRQGGDLLNPVHRQGHGRNGVGLHPSDAEGGVAEVLHDYPVGSALSQGQGLLLGAIQHPVHVTAPLGRPGQRRQVDDADKDFFGPE